MIVVLHGKLYFGINKETNNKMPGQGIIEMTPEQLQQIISAAVTAAVTSLGSNNSSHHAEKAKRPIIAPDISKEYWTDFKTKWNQYKLITSLRTDEIVCHLLECCDEDLQFHLHRNIGEGILNKSEQEILKEIKELAVKENTLISTPSAPNSEVGLNEDAVFNGRIAIPHRENDICSGWGAGKTTQKITLKLDIALCKDAYSDHEMCYYLPKSTITRSVIADTGCAVTMAGKNILQRLGLKTKHLIGLKLKIRSISGSYCTVMGGLFLEFSSIDSHGKKWVTKQLCYIQEDQPDLIYLSLAGCLQLGIVEDTFPSIGAFSVLTVGPQNNSPTLSKPLAPNTIPKKFQDVNTEAASAKKTNKPSAKKSKAKATDERQQKEKMAEDNLWQDDDKRSAKKNMRKEKREQKRIEDLQRKNKNRQLAEHEAQQL